MGDWKLQGSGHHSGTGKPPTVNPPTNPTIDKLREILEAVRIGGWYDANPNQRESDYLDVDVAEQRVIAWALEAVGEDEEIYGTTNKNKSEILSPYKTRNKLRREIRAKLGGNSV